MHSTYPELFDIKIMTQILLDQQETFSPTNVFNNSNN